MIRVSDDGRGMDPAIEEEGRRKAPDHTVGSRCPLDQEALELVFLPGLSTAEAVTNVSGRGVGMDVVQNNVRALRGNISLSSALGSGTVFAIKLPSSVMVSRGVLVESDGEQYVLPIDAVREMVKLRTADLRMHRDRALAAVRGNVHRVVSLSNLLGLRGKRSGTFSEAELNAMLLATEGEVLAVVVDRLVAEVDVVAKPLPVGYDAAASSEGRLSWVTAASRWFSSRSGSRGCSRLRFRRTRVRSRNHSRRGRNNPSVKPRGNSPSVTDHLALPRHVECAKP